jgi:hypothetical protein
LIRIWGKLYIQLPHLQVSQDACVLRAVIVERELGVSEEAGIASVEGLGP